jgi:non-heme chloroperoxidase
VARYIGRHGEARVAKVALISAVTPSALQTDANPAGVPQAAFEGLQAQLAANRSESTGLYLPGRSTTSTSRA